jgi:hypothetical protein
MNLITLSNTESVNLIQQIVAILYLAAKSTKSGNNGNPAKVNRTITNSIGKRLGRGP